MAAGFRLAADVDSRGACTCPVGLWQIALPVLRDCRHEECLFALHFFTGFSPPGHSGSICFCPCRTHPVALLPYPHDPLS